MTRHTMPVKRLNWLEIHLFTLNLGLGSKVKIEKLKEDIVLRSVLPEA